MNDDLFNELVDSVREGAEILLDERQPARTFEMEPVAIKEIREQFQLSQRQFAA